MFADNLALKDDTKELMNLVEQQNKRNSFAERLDRDLKCDISYLKKHDDLEQYQYRRRTWLRFNGFPVA